jgi:hypothetical protein
MNRQLGRTAACLAAGALLATTLVAGSASAAIPANAVLFGQADIHGYATGTEVHTAALTLGTTKLADVEQAFSGASMTSDFAGLSSPLFNELGLVVQPAEPQSVHAFGTGDGLELGLATPTTAQTDANQILLGGKPEAIAPPNTPPVTKNLLSIGSGTTAALGALVKADVLNGEGAAIYDPAQCPIGQPISYGIGNAADVNVIPLPGVTPTLGLVGTTGTGTGVAQTASETYLSPNGDGTWGLSSTVTTDIAPVSVNLGSTAHIQVSVATNKGLNTPVSLTAKTTGESGNPGSVTLSNDDVLTVALVSGTSTTNLIQVPLGNLTAKSNGVVDLSLDLANLPVTIGQALDVLSGLASSLPGGSGLVTLIGLVQTAAAGVLGGLKAPLSAITNLVDLNLGSIVIESLPHAIGATPTTKVSPTGMSASGAIDLLKVTVGLSLTGTLGKLVPAPLNGLSIANVAAGHMEVSAATKAPIFCSIPVTKVADPPAVTAGNPFTYTIDVPDPAKLNFIDCSLSNMDVKDVISDVPGKGASTFQILSASVQQTDSSGHVNTIDVPATILPATNTTTTSASVEWKSSAAHPLTWALGSKPLVFVINLTVPKDSPSGIIEDTATATAVLTGCSGGASGSASASASAANGQPLTGSVTLQKPTVMALTSVTPSTPTTAAKTLPFTGAIGGPWQPIAGLIALGLGGGAFALVRRSRRRRPIT